MFTIGTRGSELAMWQANYVADLLGRDRARIEVIKTQGDKIQNVSFDKMEGKGFFTKEIEDALLDNRIDIAVHSMKDLPTEEVEGLVVAAITVREDPSDTLVVKQNSFREGHGFPLHEGAVVGTSSLRRMAQLKHVMPSLVVEPIRGNVTTRLRKLREGQFDAIVLATAGIKRIEVDLSQLVKYVLPYSFFIPAPGQGALAIQVRKGDEDVIEAVTGFNHRETVLTVSSERFFLQRFGGGCHIPVGAYAYMNMQNIHLTGVVAATDGSKLLRKTVTGDDPQQLGIELAEQMKQEGADGLI